MPSNLPSNFQWTRFAGLASQWAVALIALMYLGKYIDRKYFEVGSKPVFIWVLPFLFILFSLFKIIRDTKNK